MLPLCFTVNKSPWWGSGTMVGWHSQNEELNLSHLRPLTIVTVPIAQVWTRLCNYSKYEQTCMLQPLCSLWSENHTWIPSHILTNTYHLSTTIRKFQNMRGKWKMRRLPLPILFLNKMWPALKKFMYHVGMPMHGIALMHCLDIVDNNNALNTLSMHLQCSYIWHPCLQWECLHCCILSQNLHCPLSLLYSPPWTYLARHEFDQKVSLELQSPWYQSSKICFQLWGD
jgi:hypothetical protein